MDLEQDAWSWLALWVLVFAIVMLAIALALNLDVWVHLVAGALIVGALGGVAVRAGLKARGVVWTEELKEAQKRRNLQLFREVFITFPLLLGLLGVRALVDNGVLPGWAGAALLLILLVVWFWLGQRVRRHRE